MDGRSLADDLRERVRQEVLLLAERQKSPPLLATILVGDDPASATYVRMKRQACRETGILSRSIHLGADSSTEQLLHLIEELNEDREVSGILLQHPLPGQINARRAFDAISLPKDVDGVTSSGFGKSSFGLEAWPSCTPAGILYLLEKYSIPLAGSHAVVVGRSPILGRPLAMLLLQRDATVTICHSRTKDLARQLQQADLLVAACGRPRLIQGDWLKEGVVVVDAGYNPGNIGDVDFDSCSRKASHITPVPGGVGPMTIAMLLLHTLRAAQTATKATFSNRP